MCHAVIEPGIWAKGCFKRQSLLGNPLCVLRLEVTLSRPTSHAGELQAVTDFSSPPPCSSLAAQGQRPTCRANTAVAGLLFPKMKQSWAVLPSQIQSKSDVTDGLMGLLCLEFLKPGKNAKKCQPGTNRLKPCHASHTFAAVLGALQIVNKLVPSDHRIKHEMHGAGQASQRCQASFDHHQVSGPIMCPRFT